MFSKIWRERLCSLTFAVNLWHFSMRKVFCFTKNPTGNHVGLLSAVYNVLIHEIIEISTKKCIKSLKIGNAWNISQFRCQFESLSFWDTTFFSWKPSGHLDYEMYVCWLLLVSKPRILSNNRQKIWRPFSSNNLDLIVLKSLLDNELFPCWKFSTF